MRKKPLYKYRAARLLLSLSKTQKRGWLLCILGVWSCPACSLLPWMVESLEGLKVWILLLFSHINCWISLLEYVYIRVLRDRVHKIIMSSWRSIESWTEKFAENATTTRSVLILTSLLLNVSNICSDIRVTSTVWRLSLMSYLWWKQGLLIIITALIALCINSNISIAALSACLFQRKLNKYLRIIRYNWLLLGGITVCLANFLWLYLSLSHYFLLWLLWSSFFNDILGCCRNLLEAHYLMLVHIVMEPWN